MAIELLNGGIELGPEYPPDEELDSFNEHKPQIHLRGDNSLPVRNAEVGEIVTITATAKVVSKSQEEGQSPSVTLELRTLATKGASTMQDVVDSMREFPVEPSPG